MGLTIEFSSVGGDTATLQVLYTHTVAHLKDELEKVWCNGRVVNLVHKGVVLDDSKTVSQTALRDGDHVVATTQGGVRKAPAGAAADALTEEASAAGGAKVRRAFLNDMGVSKTKCAVCKTSLNLVAQCMPCRCSQCFCDKHRAPERHSCSVNHGQMEREKLADKLIPKATPQDSNAQAVFVYSRYKATHKQRRGRQLHAAAFASVLVAIISAMGSHWDGVGVPTWVKRVFCGLAVGYALSSLAHSERITKRKDEEGEYCVWSREMRTNPMQCFMAECRNVAAMAIDAVTFGFTNCLTPTLQPWLRTIEPNAKPAKAK